jgi:hypothetical protein
MFLAFIAQVSYISTLKTKYAQAVVLKKYAFRLWMISAWCLGIQMAVYPVKHSGYYMLDLL